MQVKYYRDLLFSEPGFYKCAPQRRLNQEYFVDKNFRTEEERLNFIKNNQGSVSRIATREEIDKTVAGERSVQTAIVYFP